MGGQISARPPQISLVVTGVAIINATNAYDSWYISLHQAGGISENPQLPGKQRRPSTPYHLALLAGVIGHLPDVPTEQLERLHTVSLPSY